VVEERSDDTTGMWFNISPTLEGSQRISVIAV
jgi:hypothetical protein